MNTQGKSDEIIALENLHAENPLLQFFAYEHLPPYLQNVSAPFKKLALDTICSLPKNAERTTALRKLLESKDCALRAVLYKP